MQGFSAGSFAVAAFSVSAFSLDVEVPPAPPTIPAERFCYAAQLSPALQGRYTGDPAIGRMAQRLRRNKRW